MSPREIDYAARREYGRQVIQAGVSAFNNAKHPTMHQSILNWMHGSISDTALIRGMPPVAKAALVKNTVSAAWGAARDEAADLVQEFAEHRLLV